MGEASKVLSAVSEEELVGRGELTGFAARKPRANVKIGDLTAEESEKLSVRS